MSDHPVPVTMPAGPYNPFMHRYEDHVVAAWADGEWHYCVTSMGRTFRRDGAWMEWDECSRVPLDLPGVETR